jgi:preprotein translocase subunit SecG
VGVLGLSVLFGFQWLVYSVFIGLVWFGIGLFMVFYKRKKEDKREEEQEKKN